MLPQETVCPFGRLQAPNRLSPPPRSRRRTSREAAPSAGRAGSRENFSAYGERSDRGGGTGGANAGNQSSTAGRSWPEGPGKVAVHLVLLLAGDGRAGLGERGPGSHPHSPRCCRQRSPPFSSLGAGSGRSVSFP